ncbi:MAG: putative addiction module antidote protein [Planctomycetaceae bacterium]|jgi:probable addiction module antidote protein|nr:putative addiction module antidote protein [Planctomycetaceae bacterium]
MTETTEIKDWDMAENIKTKEDVLAYLEGAVEENDPQFLAKVIGYIARSEGMNQIAQELKLKRDENMSFASIVKMLSALGFQFSIQQRKAL